MADAKRGLGRGLSALLADLGTEEAPPSPDRLLPIDSLRPNPDQPRRTFAPEALAELAASIREKGVIQPLIVRPDPQEPGAWQIVAGERRWRASQEAGLLDVPAIVRNYSDAEVLEVAIIENVQRADLNAIDEGAAYRQLMERFGHTQEAVAQALGKSRSHVANALRLLNLPVDVQEMVVDGRLTAGHARPLVGHPDAAKLASRIAVNRLSARQAEQLARKPDAPRRKGLPKDADTAAIESDLSALLKMRVTITHEPGTGRGRLTLSYNGLDQLDDLLRRLAG